MRSTETSAAAAAVAVVILSSVSCRDPEMRDAKQPPARSEADAVAALSRRTIYFGHQSVGANVVDGIRDVLRENPQAHWTIVELKDAGDVRAPALVHSWIGRNGFPVSKLEAFSEIVRRGAPRFDVALVKFCFVDFTDETHVPDLFRTYAETLASLSTSCPDTTFVHVTVPLTGEPGGLKWIARNAVKRLVGRKVRGPRDNVKINEFNDLMRSRYLGKEPLFDLAALESTRADGHDLHSLAPEYNYDGAHLNERGRRLVAGELLKFLAALPEKR
jgi:hypothetical protein